MRGEGRQRGGSGEWKGEGKEALVVESEASSRIPGDPGCFETGIAVPPQAATSTSDQGDAKSAPDKATHLAVCPSPFLGDEGCYSFDGSITLSRHEAVDGEDKRGEVLALAFAQLEVLRFLLSFMSG